MIGQDDLYDSPIGVVFPIEQRRQSIGQIKLKRGDVLDSVVVSFVDDDIFQISLGTSLHGLTKAGKVSLLECVRGGPPARTHWEDFTIQHGDVSFRYALFGKEHVTVDQSCIRGVQFTLEGVESSVFMRNQSENFGLILDPSDEIIAGISRQRPDDLNRKFIKDRRWFRIYRELRTVTTN